MTNKAAMISLVIDVDVLNLIEKEVEILRSKHPYHKINRSNFIMYAVQKYIESGLVDISMFDIKSVYVRKDKREDLYTNILASEYGFYPHPYA